MLFWECVISFDTNSVRFMEIDEGLRFDYYVLKDAKVNAFFGGMIWLKIISSVQRVLQCI